MHTHLGLYTTVPCSVSALRSFVTSRSGSCGLRRGGGVVPIVWVVGIVCVVLRVCTYVHYFGGGGLWWGSVYHTKRINKPTATHTHHHPLRSPIAMAANAASSSTPRWTVSRSKSTNTTPGGRWL